MEEILMSDFEIALKEVNNEIQKAMDNEETSVSIDFTNLGDEELCARVVKTLDKKQFTNRMLKTHLGVFLTVFWYNKKII